jgi:DNA polymerase
LSRREEQLDVTALRADVARFLAQQAALGDPSVILPEKPADAPPRSLPGEAENPVAKKQQPEPQAAEHEPTGSPAAPRVDEQVPADEETWTAPDGRVVQGSPRRIRLAQLFYEVRDCRSCALAETRRRFVFGAGSADPRVVLVGEAPGAEEDRRGLPFVGPAGHLLDELMQSAGLSRKTNVFICNVLKCRPPGNRDPLPTEVAACDPLLRRQLEILQPQMLIALGRFAAQSLTGEDLSMARLRCRMHDHHGVPLIATYHPAYVLRNPAARPQVEADFREAALQMGLISS